jgi:hypothetical protein
MTDNFEADISFLNALFTDEVYMIGQKKYASKASTNPVNRVSEEAIPYQKNIDLVFSGTQSQTLLAFNFIGDDAIPDADKLFLDQVLKAAGLSFDNLSRLYLGSHQNGNWTDIAAQSASDFVIAFGIPQNYLPEAISEGEIYNINNKRVLCNASLAELSTNGNKKKMLWQGLKEIYGL